MNGHCSQTNAPHVLGMLAGLTIAPVATPALIWVSLATNLPLAVMIPQLIVMAMVAHWLSRITVHACKLVDGWREERAG
jgi:hypothetical protein